MAIQDAMVLVLPAAARQWHRHGGRLQADGRGSRQPAMRRFTSHAGQLVGAAMGSGKSSLTYSGYTVNVPQLEADVDREKAKIQGVPLANLFETLQINLGSLYVNDFNRFGRTYQVVAQAEQQFRDDVGDITRFKTRNMAGDMVPIGSLVKVKERLRPGSRHALQRLPRRRHQWLAAAAAELRAGRRSHLQSSPKRPAGGFEFEWTDLTYPKDHRGQHGHLHLPALHPARLHGARGAV
jgi:multidrug efflux pump subunit AcrB